MENSSHLLFGDDASEWYVALGERWIGPMKASEIYERIQTNQLSWAHFVWKKGQSEWKRICDTKAFQAAGPHQPAKAVQKEVQKTVVSHSKPAPQVEAVPQKIWFLYVNDAQTGPFSVVEVKHLLTTERITLQTHAWTQGMKGWERVGQIEQFQVAGAKPSAKQTALADKRQAPRRPLIAKIMMTDEQSVIVGVCRDISIGGLQVLTDRVPGKMGTRLKMNISTSSNESGTPIEPFVAEGVIVRLLEDGRGFSFRFEKLSERAKHSIETYFASAF